MENAVDALKIAFAVMVFTIALSVAMATFSQARETSEAVLYMNDKTNYYEYEEVKYDEVNDIYTVESEGITYTSERIVGIETIIPTLYRYYKENYTVIFVDESNNPIPIYYLDSTDKWDKYYTNTTRPINYFDLNSEIKANCPWVGTVNDIKKNLDLFMKGTEGLAPTDKSFGNINRTVQYRYGSGGSKGFMEEYANATFLEQLGEYSTDRNYGIETDTEGKKWLTISSGSHAGKYRYNPETGKVNQHKGDFPDDLDIQCTTKVADFLEDKGIIANNATTYYNPDDPDETNGEIIELAKPTIKRVIKYTLQ